MSILIRGMEMPDRCGNCWFFTGYFEPCPAYYGIPARAKEYFDCVDNETKPSWCPLVSVPPHGRLIDERDAYDNIAEAAGEESGGYVDMDIVGRGLECTPTVIEAEEGET